MVAAFQQNAFQNNAFQVGGTVSTAVIQLPINCVLADQQLYKARIDVHDIGPARITHKTAASGSELRQLGGNGPPSFTVKTGNKGYD